MAQQLPFIPDVPNYRVGTTLQNVQFLFDVRWNSRTESWYMDMRASDGSLILAGIRLVLGVFLTRLSKDDRLPDGEFIVSDLSDTGTEATLEDLGVRVAVYFLPDSELESGDII